MKNNILIPFITIFTSFACCSTNHNGINPERLHTVDFLSQTLYYNPEWKDFCDEQKDNSQCKFFENASKQLINLQKTKDALDISNIWFKRAVYFRHMHFIADQLNDDSYYAAMEKNWHELSLQMKEQK